MTNEEIIILNTLSTIIVVIFVILTNVKIEKKKG